jgi:hypothetical protein
MHDHLPSSLETAFLPCAVKLPNQKLHPVDCIHQNAISYFLGFWPRSLASFAGESDQDL